MAGSFLRCLVGTLAFSSALAAPSHKKSPRDTAGVPVTKNVVQLRKATFKDYVTPVGAPFRVLPVDSALDDPPAKGVGIAENAARGVEYIIDVEVGNANYSLIIDTGSSDTWVARDNFACLDTSSRAPRPQTACKFGPLFKGDYPGGQIPGQVFSIQYGSSTGPFVRGTMGYADVDVAGIHLPKQQVAFAETGAWRGDSITSGILGLGLPALTEAYSPTGEAYTYDPIVTTMQSQGIPPVFSLALSRDPKESFLAFGGIPDVETDAFVSTPIIKASSGIYARYTVQPQLIVANSSSGRAATSKNPVPLLVDSGTTLTLLPYQNAEVINSLFVPPATLISSQGGWFVPCNATPPTLGFQFGGKMIYTEPASMILPEIKDDITGMCATGISATNSAPYILGDTFMQGIVAVFDISSKMEIRFAHRK